MVVAVGVVLLASCGMRQVTPLALESPLECGALPAPPTVAGAVTFALLDPVDLGRAPWASNASEQIVFGHLYETLTTVDCVGEVRPGLAESWHVEEEGLRWTFELRGNASFWDGTPVTARDVVASWQDALTLDTVIDSASAAADRKLYVYLRQPYQQADRVLSASVYAVTKRSDDPRWLMGSGPYRVGGVDLDAHPAPRRTITVHPAFGLSGPVIRFVETSAEEARDGLESTIDVMVTGDPSVIEYAAGRSQFLTVALPWDRTYVLLSTSRVEELGKGCTFAAVSSDVLEGLARDAVQGDARGYQPPSWWDELAGCGESPGAGAGLGLDRPGIPSSGSSQATRRIVYDASDPVARGLAERIVAIAAAGTARSPEAKAIASAVPRLSSGASGTIASGLTREDFERSLRRGDEFAYVVSIPRRPPDPCYEARELADRAPWLAGTGHGLAEVLVPFVDARSHLIVEKDTVELTVDGHGSVLVTPAGQQNR